LSLKRLLPLLLLALPLYAQQPGQLTERIVTKEDPQQSYAVYLPSKYDAKKRWPTLFVFDPDARGKLGVETFREAAEKYGYIVAASNNSKNGPPRPQIDAFVAMSNDVVRRFSTDTDHLYAAGFSGGARVAGMVTFYCSHCIRAVIACGAGFPAIKPEALKQLPGYFFTVGKYDFNYFEVLDAARANTQPTAVAVFDGTHQWPPAEVAMQAVAWLDAGAKERNVPATTPAEEKQRKRQQELVSPIFGAIVQAQQRQAPTPGQLGDTSDTREGTTPVTFADARSAMAALRKKREQAGGEDLVVYRRALGQALAYTYENGLDLELKNKFELAANYFEVASAAIPPNPGITYETASAWAAAGNKKKALASLKQAIALGFHDTTALAADHHFDELRSSKDFQALLATMH
jgi:poly(3-hydroxybutyrate) depolymerase